METFKEKYLAGQLAPEEIDDYVEVWNTSDPERPLAAFLGLNADEEDAWISVGEDALFELLDRQKKGAKDAQF